MWYPAISDGFAGRTCVVGGVEFLLEQKQVSPPHSINFLPTPIPFICAHYLAKHSTMTIRIPAGILRTKGRKGSVVPLSFWQFLHLCGRAGGN